MSISTKKPVRVFCETLDAVGHSVLPVQEMNGNPGRWIVWSERYQSVPQGGGRISSSFVPEGNYVIIPDGGEPPAARVRCRFCTLGVEYGTGLPCPRCDGEGYVE